jgi:DNA-binding transcriptional ArsR family regulator
MDGWPVKDAEKTARVFKLLGVDTRVRIVQMLKKRSLCVNALARQLGVSAAAVSQHLRVLRDGELVTAEKKGYYVHYRVNERTLERFGRLVADLLGGRGE